MDGHKLNGSKTAIAILDTKIFDTCHVNCHCAINCCGEELTPGLHGSICATIAACSRDDNYFLRGVAPHAEVDMYEIAKCDNDSNTQLVTNGILVALRQIIENIESRKVDVVSISYEIPEDDRVIMTQISAKIAELTDKRVVVVAAAGNKGLYDTDAASPAFFSNVISVGSFDRNGDPSKFNPNADKIDVYAPGELTFDKEIRGTSYAAPAIGGIVLLLKQLANEIGSPVIENIHRVNVLKTILKKMKTDGGLPVCKPVDFLFKWSKHPGLLRELVEECLVKNPR